MTIGSATQSTSLDWKMTKDAQKATELDLKTDKDPQLIY
jgi:hypothetical protein